MTIRQLHYILSAGLIALSLMGCGKANDKSPAVSAAGKHPADWYTAHRNAFSKEYLADGAQMCKECHGLNLGSTDPLLNTGGITKVGCILSTSGGRACHAGGHGPRAIPHALPFMAASQHGPSAKADLTYCQACHGNQGGQGTNPRFITQIGSLTRGCEDCHKIGTAHPPVDPSKPNMSGYPSSWNGHASAGNLASSCSLCHGIDYGGKTVFFNSTTVTAPACRSCHTNLPLNVVPVAGLCTSCHSKPPATGAHIAHNSVASLTSLCGACHHGFGSGNGDAKHGKRGFINISTAIAPEFNAKNQTGRVTAARTCTNVSCHGGVTTPPWRTGSIDGTNQCASCHLAGSASQTPQYNSYFSGEHTRHINIGLACTDCHDMSVTSSGKSHFSNLATPAFELAPSLTIRSQVHYTGGSCSPGANPPNGTFSFGVCHGTQSW